MLNSQQQEQAVRLLSHETIRALDGMHFARKAQTIPSLVEVLESIDDVAMIGPDVDPDDPQMIDTKETCRLDIEHEERMIVLPAHIIVGGLISDHQALNPLEDWDGEGKIVHFGRRAINEEERAEFFSALGLDSEGKPILTGRAIGAFMLKRVWGALTSSHLQLMFDLIALANGFGITKPLKNLIHQAIEACDDEDWGGSIAEQLITLSPMNLDEEDFQPIDQLSDLVESLAKAAWEDAMAAGKIGNPLAVKLDIYEHSGRHYSVSGEGMQSQWDTSRCAAVWVPCDVAAENICTMSDGEPEASESRRAKAVEYCRSVLENYNSYISGEVYGVVVYVLDRATGERIEAEDDECWGHFGYSSAKEEIEISILATALRFTEPASAEAVAH